MTDERIEFYKQAIEKMPGLGESLLERLCAQKDAIPRNVIVTIFVRKGTRLVKAVGCLLENSLVEESQVLCRVLFETMVTFEYFLKLAKDDYDEVFRRYVHSFMLDKIKQLEAVDYRTCPSEKKDFWLKTKDEIERAYDLKVLKKIKRYGFACMSFEQVANDTGNGELYDLVYRFYSRNIHAADANENLTAFLRPEAWAEYADSMKKMVLEVTFRAGDAILANANEWAGRPCEQ
ncbi:MAG: hypothetical protein A2Y77_07455 [Planctomycetes bacterium RBG_13_62_9]|nr:MAG: hypothetical protein A2Y77_07455 [Planctomycetes bacterium RBG_13_62_9]